MHPLFFITVLPEAQVHLLREPRALDGLRPREVRPRLCRRRQAPARRPLHVPAPPSILGALRPAGKVQWLTQWFTKKGLAFQSIVITPACKL